MMIETIKKVEEVVVGSTLFTSTNQQDDAMSVISCLTLETTTNLHAQDQDQDGNGGIHTNVNGGKTPTTPDEAGLTTIKKGMIVKKLKLMMGKNNHNERQKNQQEETHGQIASNDTSLPNRNKDVKANNNVKVGDLERGDSKTTVMTSPSSYDDDVSIPSSSRSEEPAITLKNTNIALPQKQHQYSLIYGDEMRGFFIAISITCLGMFMLGLACFVWWATHTNTYYNGGVVQHTNMHSNSTSKTTDGQHEHFIPGSRIRYLEHKDSKHYVAQARFSFAPEVQVMDYMLFFADLNKNNKST